MIKTNNKKQIRNKNQASKIYKIESFDMVQRVFAKTEKKAFEKIFFYLVNKHEKILIYSRPTR